MVNTNSFRTIQSLIDYIEHHGYTFSRSSGSHKIYSALNKQNIVLVYHNSTKERPHPKAIRQVLKLTA
jgi:predicted RNA binding protein YcfA (HicA-like mRNA interferase family)